MESISSTLMQSLSGDNLATIGNLIGTDRQGAQSILSTAVPLLLGSMAKTAAQPGGAATLTGMLGDNRLAGAADDVGGYLSHPDVSGGSNTLGTLLGNQQGALTDLIARQTGFSADAISRALAIMAPIVLGFVGKLMRQQNLDAGALTSFLGTQSEMALANTPDAKSILASLVSGAAGGGGFLGRLKKLFVG
jgi:hypothetical protein